MRGYSVQDPNRELRGMYIKWNGNSQYVMFSLALVCVGYNGGRMDVFADALVPCFICDPRRRDLFGA